jgi:hypothetical protein
MTKTVGAGLPSGLSDDTEICSEPIKGALDTLPYKKQIFVEELFRNGFNKTQAALKAGSKNPEAAIATATNWLKEDKVKLAIEELRHRDSKADKLTVEDLKVELWRNHIRAERVSDSNKSLELICRLLGGFKDTVDVKGTVGFAQVIADLRQNASKLADVEEAVLIDLPDKEEDVGSSTDKELKDSDKGDSNGLEN